MLLVFAALKPYPCGRIVVGAKGEICSMRGFFFRNDSEFISLSEMRRSLLETKGGKEEKISS